MSLGYSRFPLLGTPNNKPAGTGGSSGQSRVSRRALIGWRNWTDITTISGNLRDRIACAAGGHSD